MRQKIPGSRSPERVPMTTPPSGVRPIEVSTDKPCLTAVTEQPFPRWQVMRRKSFTFFARYFAATCIYLIPLCGSNILWAKLVCDTFIIARLLPHRKVSLGNIIMAGAMEAITLNSMLSSNLLVDGICLHMSWHSAVKGSVKDCHMFKVWEQLHSTSDTCQICRHMKRGQVCDCLHLCNNVLGE